MKRIADRTSKAVTKQSTSVQPFAGGILNKYKTSAGRNKFERVAMSHVLKSQPSITQQTLHIQVLAPKAPTPKQSSIKKAAPSPERRVERRIERERVTVVREKIVFRDVTHVIKEQRTVREIAMTQPAAGESTAEAKRSLSSSKLLEAKVESSVKQINKTVQSSKLQAGKSVDISNKQLEKAVQSLNKQAEKNRVTSQSQLDKNRQNSNKQTSGKSVERSVIQRDKKSDSSTEHLEKPMHGEIGPAKVKRELSQGTIPQAAGMPVKAWTAEQQADYYKWLQAKLQPGIVIQSIRRLEELRKPLEKARVQLLPSSGKSPGSSALQLTNARRAVLRQEQPAEAARQEAERSAASAGLEQREAAKRAEAVRHEAERSAASAGLEQREAAKRAEAVRHEAERSAASAGLEQREAAKRAEAVRHEAEKSANRASQNRRQALEHRKDQQQGSEQTEETGRAATHRNEHREGAAASRLTTNAARSAIKPFETSIARQSGDWVITGSVADHNRIRLQLLTLLRKPQTSAVETNQSTGANSRAISAKRFIHRTQREQAEQSLANDHLHIANPSTPGRTNQVLPSDKPSTKATDSANGLPARKPETVAVTNSSASSAAANESKAQAKHQGQHRNKKPDAAATDYFKAAGIGKSSSAAKPAQLILRRFEERFMQQAAEPRLSQLKRQAAADSINRPPASRSQHLSGSTSNHQDRNANAAARGRKAVIHRKASAQPMPRPEQEQDNTVAAPAKTEVKGSANTLNHSLTRAITDTPAEALLLTKSPANMQNGEKADSEAERQLAARGQLLARETGKRTKLMQGALRLSHKQLRTTFPETGSSTGNSMQHKKRAGTLSTSGNNGAAGNGFVIASHKGRRKNGQNTELMPSKVVPAVRSMSEAGKQADLSKQSPAMPNDIASEPIQPVKAALVQREDTRMEPLIVRAVPSPGRTEQAADPKAGTPVSSQLPKAAASKFQRQPAAVLNRIASASLVQRSTRGKVKASGSAAPFTKAAKQSLTASTEAVTRQSRRSDLQGSSDAAVKASASLRAYPALSVQKKVSTGAGDANQDVGASRRTVVQPSSISSPYTAGLNKLVQKAQPTAFSSRGMQAGSRMFETIQRRSASASSAAAAQVRNLTALQGLTTVVQAGDNGSSGTVLPAGPANEQVRLSYAAAAGNRNGIGAAAFQSGDSSSFPSADRGGMPTLSHHKPKQAAPQEPPRQVKVDAPRELDPEKLQKMIMKIPQLRPEAIADQVYKALERKMKLEQRRRGY